MVKSLPEIGSTTDQLAELTTAKDLLEQALAKAT